MSDYWRISQRDVPTGASDAMKYRNLGSTGLRVSVIGVGTWQFGGEWNKTFTQDEVDAMLRRARELGINLIDTAECYGDHLSESLIGNAIQNDRKDWIIATKFGHRYYGHLNRTDPRAPRDVEQQLADSLRALKKDHIDVYQYHSWPDQQFEDLRVLDVLHRAKRAGKIRHIGNSVSSALSIRQIEVSRQRDMEVIQLIYNRLDRRAEDKAFELCRGQDLGVLARVPLASGYLAGNYQPGATFAPDDVRASHTPEWRDETIQEALRIRREEIPPGTDMAAWALAWCLKNPEVSSVIPGSKSVRQVESNARAADLI